MVYKLDGLISCGVTTQSIVVSTVKFPKTCFTFKTMQQGRDVVIINKEEFERFLKSIGWEKTDTPCP